MNSREKLIQRTMDVQREITKEGLKRRDLMKMGLLSATTGMLLPIPGLSLRAALASSSCPVPGKDMISPPTRPWVEEMPRLEEKQVVLGNDPANISHGNGGGAPGRDPVGTLTGGDSKILLKQNFPELFLPFPAGATPDGLSHQAWDRFPPKQWYEMHVKQFNHVWHQDMPAGSAGQPAWGFDGQFPGPMLRTRYGVSHFVRIHNDLPEQNPGFGINQISTHLHNAHSPAESDGNPLFTNYSGHYYDYHYPNVYAGVNQYGGIGDPREALGTMFYHDHQLDFTAQNVYAGLAGMNCIYDDVDSGDPDEEKGLRLPCGANFEFDVGLVFHDRQFDTHGVDFFPLTCFDGAIGDKMTVNGKIQPYFPVKRRKYRFRMCNLGPSRLNQWFLHDEKTRKYLPFTVIANDGNLLPAPIQVPSLHQDVAERLDIIIDFSKYQSGQEFILYNRAEQRSGRGATGNLLSPGFAVLKFIVTSDIVADNSVIPASLRELPDIKQPVAKKRVWKFDRSGGEWTVNGQPYNRDYMNAIIPEGTAEQWTLINGGGSWTHPVHSHFEECRILSYNRVAPPLIASGRKDMISLEPNAQAEVYMRFRDFKGHYVMHCHNVVHEDHAMMINFKVV
ncbi:MAG: multicopper oxidase family protein [Methylophilaceae bacterium]